jgi:hypothetical protein
LPKHLAFFAQITASFWKKVIITFFLWSRPFFAENWQKSQQMLSYRRPHNVPSYLKILCCLNVPARNSLTNKPWINFLWPYYFGKL